MASAPARQALYSPWGVSSHSPVMRWATTEAHMAARLPKMRLRVVTVAPSISKFSTPARRRSSNSASSQEGR